MAVKRITLKDIAEKAGVSTAVVSCVVNNKPNGYGNIFVSAPLREKIKVLAKEMNYRPSRLAKALKTGDNRTIGVIAVHSFHPLHNYRNFKLCEMIVERGYDYIMQLVETGQAEAFRKGVEMLLDYGVQGLIISDIQADARYFEEIGQVAAGGLPVVEISARSHGDFPFITSDYYSAAVEMAEAVIASGRKDVCVVTSGEYAILTTDATLSLSQRISAIKDVCSRNDGVTFNIFYRTAPWVPSNTENGYVTTKELLSKHVPDAIFYSNDFFAIGGLKALKEKGIRVPEDVSVCGFDGVDVAAFTEPPITTAVQPIEEMAVKTIETLFEMIDGKAKVANRSILLPCEVVFRESTGILIPR